MGNQPSATAFVAPTDQPSEAECHRQWQQQCNTNETLRSALNGKVMVVEISSRWVYRRGCRVLDASAATYWTKGDRFDFVNQGPCQDDWDVEHQVEYTADGELTPAALMASGEQGEVADLISAVDWEDNVDVEGCNPADAVVTFSVDGVPICRTNLQACVSNGNCRVEYDNDGPADAADVNGVSTGDILGATLVPPGLPSDVYAGPVETLIDSCATDKDCSWSGAHTCGEGGVLGLNPALLTFHITQWHSPFGEDVGELLTGVSYGGVQLEGEGHWDSSEGCQGGTAALVQRESQEEWRKQEKAAHCSTCVPSVTCFT